MKQFLLIAFASFTDEEIEAEKFTQLKFPNSSVMEPELTDNNPRTSELEGTPKLSSSLNLFEAEAYIAYCLAHSSPSKMVI